MWKDVKWAVAISLLAALVVIGYGLYQPLKYEATARVMVEQGYASKASDGKIQLIPNAIWPGSLGKAASGMARAVDSPSVSQAVVKRLNLPKGSAGKVLKNISAEQDPGTMFIDVSYKDSNQKRAQQVANAIGQVVSQKISEVSPGANAITAMIWEPATYPQTPVSPKPLRNGIITLVIGLVLSTVAIAIREYRRTHYHYSGVQ